MAIEYKPIVINFEGSKLTVEEKPKDKENRIEATRAGKFLERSGLMNLVMEYQKSLLEIDSDIRGEIESEIDEENSQPKVPQPQNLFNDLSPDPSGQVLARAGIVLEWTLPDNQRSICQLRVQAIKNNHNDRYITGSVRKRQNQREIFNFVLRYYPYREFNFNDVMKPSDKLQYREWFERLVDHPELK